MTTATTAACPVCGGELPDDDSGRVYCQRSCRARAKRQREAERKPNDAATQRLARTIEPVRGPLFERVVRASIEGVKRKRLAALIAAYHDADPSYAPLLDELCARLRVGKPVLFGLLGRLEQDGHVSRFVARRGRVTVELALDERAAA